VIIFLTGIGDQSDPPQHWPAPGPDAIVYLAGKGIRCVAIDAPTLGGNDTRRLLMTYWALGSNGMVGIESLSNLAAMVGRPFFFLFQSQSDGTGRAIALY
jgi:kynurenine formamidase